jgi:hypothetical protein
MWVRLPPAVLLKKENKMNKTFLDLINEKLKGEEISFRDTRGQLRKGVIEEVTDIRDWNNEDNYDFDSGVDVSVVLNNSDKNEYTFDINAYINEK